MLKDNRFKIFGWNCRNITGKSNRILFNSSMEKLLPDLKIMNEARNYDRKWEKELPDYSYLRNTDKGSEVMIMWQEDCTIKKVMEKLNDEHNLIAKFRTFGPDGLEGE